MNFFTLDIKKIIVFIAVITIPLISINVRQNPETDPWFLRPFSFFTGIVQSGYATFASGIRGTTSMYLDLVDIKIINRELQKSNAELRAKLGEMNELRLENERLRSLVGFQEKSPMELLAATVIGKDLMPEHQTITINRGTRHGVKQNMAAITVGGVVGYVIQAELFSSVILLMTDRYAAIDSLVQRSRARGIIEGRSRDCRLSHLQRGDDVQVGDLIVTSGLHKVFPKGFPLGSVTSVKKSRYGMSQEVEVKPVVNASNLEEVFIVLNAKTDPERVKPEETENKTKSPATKKLGV